MANCFIPNSTPATGRTSTTSSRRSRRLNSTTPLGEALSLTAVTELSIRKVFNAQRSTFNAQRSIQTVGRGTLDVGRWTFSFYGRVKGAWWPSRSSKPSSPCKRRGRFDSYPLRSFCAVPVAVSLCETRTSPTGRRLQRSLVKGGESDVT
jgi:hypothetical protein